jgi:lipopolysaccharide/colanic/teichoic acid biosynthesis glycosyltransferase
VAVLTEPGDAHLDGFRLAGGFYLDVQSDAAQAFAPRHWYAHTKRAIDIVAASVLLLLLLPILLVISLAVILDSGTPVLFRQTRVGRGGKPFEMLKFRTMRSDRRRRSAGPPVGMSERRLRHKSIRDPRVTRLGRFLRRACLDELPQLWNVLRGEMSLVGPRPELPSIVDAYQPWQHLRHLVAPGITGWWQINRCEDRLMHESTELDIYYVRHHSVLLDLRILARTLSAVIEGRGAY